jgi:hypothetical protein
MAGAAGCLRRGRSGSRVPGLIATNLASVVDDHQRRRARTWYLGIGPGDTRSSCLINPGERQAITVTRGHPDARLSGPDCDDRTDSQADSESSIPLPAPLRNAMPGAARGRGRRACPRWARRAPSPARGTARQAAAQKSPKYPSSTLARCLTNPSRLVPVGVSGRRMSYSESPSSFHSRASRAPRR